MGSQGFFSGETVVGCAGVFSGGGLWRVQGLSVEGWLWGVQGFSVEGEENIQEILSKRLYLCQALCALMVLRTG